MNIVLIGYRCAGKTVVGKELASRMQRRFVDTDDFVESKEGQISEIVKVYGWDYFRTMEKGIIEEISKEDNLVIALGGGAVLDPDNIINLERNGLIIWLKADREVLQKRMSQDPRTIASRPTLTGKGTVEELEELIVQRDPLYGKASKIQFDTSDLNVEAVVEKILAVLQEKLGRV
ncbi:MAG TPA: shikimate kinase [Thermodesulfobacteriota bacterium]|nr:shikimate kinase [Thermodesulfobacteriota bacterium]